MSYFDTLFGFWGLPLMVSVGSGVIFGIPAGMGAILVWCLCFFYVFVKFGDFKEESE